MRYIALYFLIIIMLFISVAVCSWLYSFFINRKEKY